VSLLKPHEAVAIAAVLQTMRDEGALPVRRPSWEQPTFYSKPLTVTGMPLLQPSPGPLFDYVDVLRWVAPVQYITVITGYVATTVNNPLTAQVDFQIAVDGGLLQGIALSPAANPFKGALYPVTARPTQIALNETQVFTIRARNLGVIPQTLLLSIQGWSYPTTTIERGSDGSGSQGITDV
jgi:hypothetical protein